MFYVLATFKVMLVRVLSNDSAHSRHLYNAAPLGGKDTSAINWYLTQSCYPDTEWANQSIQYPNNAKHRPRKRQMSIFKSLVSDDHSSNPWVRIPRSTKTGDVRPSSHSAIPSGQQPNDSSTIIVECIYRARSGQSLWAWLTRWPHIVYWSKCGRLEI